MFSINLHAEENKIKTLYEQNNINGSILIESLNGKISHSNEASNSHYIDSW